MQLLTLIILLSVWCAPVLAETFEIVSTNSEAYSVGAKLSNQTQLRLGVDKWLKLKASNGKIYLIEGPYQEDDKKNPLIKVLETIITPGKKDFFAQKAWKEEINQVWQMLTKKILGMQLGNHLNENQLVFDVSPNSSKLWTLTPWDKDFCYSVANGFNIEHTLPFDRLKLTFIKEKSGSEKETVPEIEKASEPENISLIHLHQMPNKKWDSKTYQAIWMVEQGCYRQAELLLRVKE